MSASALWSLHAEGVFLHPAIEFVVRMDERRTFEAVSSAEVSGLLQQLAEDEALIRRGLELAERLEQAFRAAAADRPRGDVAQLVAYADLWAERARAYVRCGARTVFRAQRVACQAELLTAAAAKQMAAENARAERLLAVRAAIERALTTRAEEEQLRVEALRAEEKRIEAQRAEEKRLEAQRAEEKLVEEKRVEAQLAEAERASTERVLAVRAAAGRALAKRMEWVSEQKRDVVAEVVATTDLAATREKAAGKMLSNEARRGLRQTLSRAGSGVEKQSGRPLWEQYGGAHVLHVEKLVAIAAPTYRGPGPPRSHHHLCALKCSRVSCA